MIIGSKLRLDAISETPEILNGDCMLKRKKILGRITDR